MKKLILCLIVLSWLTDAILAGEDNSQLFSVSGQGESRPRSYVPPLLANGSLNMLVDYQGCQSQRTYSGMTPGIWWAGRRYESSGHPIYPLVPFGCFEQELSCNGQTYKEPSRWTQSLNTREAVTTCQGDYGDSLSAETTVFVPLSHDVVVIKKKFIPKNQDVRSARITFKYHLVDPKGKLPKRIVINPEQNESAGCIDIKYQLDGYRMYDGVISVMADKLAKQDVEKSTFTMTADVTFDGTKPTEITFCLVFVDSMDGKDYQKRSAQLKSMIKEQGFNGLLEEHKRQWAGYWDESYVHIPAEKIEKAYYTSSYHLRANATKWSFPVGIFNTHWAGKFFGWDEMFCYQALVSSNHRDVARRCPEFRLAILKKALYRAAHYGKNGIFGARFPWEALEDGAEGTPPGFWLEHIFHTSNIALSSWFQYLYTNDADYLKKTGYPVIKECARYFLANMVYEKDDGGMFIGKCTDLERLGPAKINPFMTSCGAIYTLEAAAQAAALLKDDEKEAATWKHAATKLRESLPHDGEKYVPYAGCTERSIASLGGLFPYPVFDETNEKQKNAVLDFVTKGRASGNMYPMGNSVCAWYAGWMAAALAALGEKVEPVKLLSEAAEGAGCFGELFEINEAKVSMKPWFSTASGNVVYALNQMLVQSHGEEIRVASGVPGDWKDFSFKLACHGDLVAEEEAKNGKFIKLT
ncbi:MAG: hypothetical protein PHR77_01060, partial [Kiritimatiellae bacterium]|nr:hypothetical protein [Kiritimatiellia bacterium]